MGSLRSWLGSILTLVVFFLAKRFSTGLAAPTFISIFFACTYIWMLVLRVHDLKNIVPAEEPEPLAQPAASADIASVAQSAPAEECTVASSAGRCTAEHVESPQSVMQETEAMKEAEASALSSGEPPLASPAQEAEADQSTGIPAEGTALQRSDLSSTPDAGLSTATSAMPDGSPSADADSDASEDEEELKRREQEMEDAHCDFERAKELKLEGNELFKANKLHDAREAYSEALYLTPSTETKDKAVLHCNRAACLQKLSRWDDVVEDCKKAIELDPTYAKAYHRRSAAHEALNKWHDANEDMKKVFELDPSMKAKEYKHQAVLEARAQEQFEKDKEEMMGKLKDLGNMVLGKFGMSTDNFKMEQDPNTGSYSIKFQQ